VEEDAQTAKRMLVELEANHALGRFWDLDVIDSEGNLISRTELGYESRKCFICDGEAKACARSRKHSYEELLWHMERVFNDFKA
jgi:holo-ACP synthase